MPIQRPSARGLLAPALACVAALALLFPWWQAESPPVLLGAGPPVALPVESWSGAEVVGSAVATAGWVLALSALLAALLVARRPVLARALAAAAGGALAAAAAVASTRWDTTGNAWACLVAGAAALLLALVERPLGRGTAVGAAAALAAAVLATLLPAVASPAAGVRSGPFVRVAALGAAPGRTGTPDLPAPLAPERLALVGGRAAVVTADGLATPGPDGRSSLLTRTATDDRGRAGGVLGVSGDRVARWIDADAVVVTGLRAGDPLVILVRNVAAAGPVGTDGSLWLQAVGDPPGTVRRLDLFGYGGAQTLAAVYLPVVTISAPPGTVPLDARSLLPLPGGALRFVPQTGGVRLERVNPNPGSVDITTLAGGVDPACGLTRIGRDAFLPAGGPLAVDAAGGAWFVLDGQLAHLGSDDALRTVTAPLPGAVTALLVEPDETVAMIVHAGGGASLWRLPNPFAQLVDLPAAPADCVALPLPAAGPVALTPLGITGKDALATPLDTAGRWVSGKDERDSGLSVVGPDGARAPLGTRRGDPVDAVRPDGSGGVWWLESPAPGSLALVHARPGQVEERLPAAPDPSGGAATLLTDLGGRPPLLGTPTGAYRIADGTATRVADGAVTGGVVRADGRGWVLADGRLLVLDGDRVRGAVIDPGDRRADAAPVVVQLAKGVAPARLALPRASLGLDARGRAVVFSDGVALAVDDAGTVTPVAQDARLSGVRTVEGGLAVVMDGTLLRVELPA